LCLLSCPEVDSSDPPPCASAPSPHPVLLLLSPSPHQPLYTTPSPLSHLLTPLLLLICPFSLIPPPFPTLVLGGAGNFRISRDDPLLILLPRYFPCSGVVESIFLLSANKRALASSGTAEIKLERHYCENTLLLYTNRPFSRVVDYSSPPSERLSPLTSFIGCMRDYQCLSGRRFPPTTGASCICLDLV